MTTPDGINSAVGRDKAYHLHPYSNPRAIERDGPMVIASGRGVYVTDENGKEYLEGLAGLWCTSLGFSEARLADAANRQMRRLPFYQSFTAKVPDITTELAERLMRIAPDNMSKVFFVNSGSEANDTQVKIVWYYNNARGRPEKKKIIARQRAYHGITLGALNMTGVAYAQNGFDVPFDRFKHVSCPHYYDYAEPGESEEAFATRLAEELDRMIVAEGPETVAAFIAEPIMGAGGVVIPPPTYYEKIQAVLKKHDVLLIADEVICGFGRTGKMFGSQALGMKPDLISIAKALSSAYLPIGGVMMSDEIFQGIADLSDKYGQFGHGHTYSGHPVAAAVALETLKIYEERDILSQVERMAPVLQDGLRAFADHPLVGNVRGMGLIGAIQLVADKTTGRHFDPPQKVAMHLYQRAQHHGVILRAVPV
ncbi:MAG: aminotransferase, partial [Alphaproteobacteria bacterium]